MSVLTSFSTKLTNTVKTLKCPAQNYMLCFPLIRNQSTETLEPVKLSYATYESTVTTAKKSAPPLIIIHGLFGSKANWNSLSKMYQQKTNPQRKIIAVDTRNHGDSVHHPKHTYAHMAADIRALLGQLGISKAAFIGHSMGGKAVMIFALKYPELVDSLIVADISPVSTSPDLNTMLSVFQALEGTNLPTDLSMSQARLAVDLQLSKTIPNKGLRSFLLTNLVQRDDGSFSWRVNIPSLLTNFNNIVRFPLVNDLQYTGPVLFVGGGNSDYILRSDFPKIQKLFPNAELKYIDGAGHWLHSEKPAEFLQVTLDFLNKKTPVNA